MSADQPDALPSQPTSGPVSDAPSASTVAGPLLGVVFALLGGAVAWLILWVYHPVFIVPPEIISRGMAMSATAEDAVALAAAQRTANRWNAAFALAVIGALVGGSLGIAEGLGRRSMAFVVVGGLVCTLLGSLFGAVAGMAAEWSVPFVRPSAEAYALFGTLAVQAIGFGTLGAGVGLGLQAATRRAHGVPNLLLVGLLAGISTAVVYTLIAAVIGMLVPVIQTEITIPADLLSRAVWIGLAAVLLGAILLGAGDKPGKADRGPQSPEAGDQGDQDL